MPACVLRCPLVPIEARLCPSMPACVLRCPLVSFDARLCPSMPACAFRSPLVSFDARWCPSMACVDTQGNRHVGVVVAAGVEQSFELKASSCCEEPSTKRFRELEAQLLQPLTSAKKAYDVYYLPKDMTDLSEVIKRLERTIAQWKTELARAARAGKDKCRAHFKDRFVFKHWNRTWDIGQLQQLLTIATLIHTANGSFVPMQQALDYARSVHMSRNVMFDYRNGKGSSEFCQWVMANLFPAVQYFRDHRNSQCAGVYFYMFPKSAGALACIRAGYHGVLAQVDQVSVKSKLDQLDLRGYIDLLPSNSQKRVIVALLGRLASQTYLTSRGISAMRQKLATQRVDVALLATAEFERCAQENFGVPTDVTIEGGRKRMRLSIQQQQHEALADDHGGGRTSLLETAAQLGVELGPMIEETAAELSSLNYSSADAGRLCVSAQRDSSAMHRTCSWDSIAAAVQAKLQAAHAKCQGTGQSIPKPVESITVSEAEIRLCCIPVQANTRQGQRHTAVADLSHRKLEAGAEDWNIDGHSSNARVRVYEQFCLYMLRVYHAAMLMYSDDHAKWEADKNRGHLNRGTILHKHQRKTAAHQDMRPPIPGVKVITDSILICAPEGTFDGHSNSKRDVRVEKMGFAVCRLQSELPSNPAQSVNDYELVFSDEKMSIFMDSQCTIIVSITDGGFDHQPRSWEVQYHEAFLFLKRDLDYWGHVVRAAGLSS